MFLRLCSIKINRFIQNRSLLVQGFGWVRLVQGIVNSRGSLEMPTSSSHTKSYKTVLAIPKTLLSWALLERLKGEVYISELFLLRYSDELVFANFGQPLYLPTDEKLRFWYGDDLKNHSEGDNQGQVCFHVFALFM